MYGSHSAGAGMLQPCWTLARCAGGVQARQCRDCGKRCRSSPAEAPRLSHYGHRCSLYLTLHNA